MRRRTILVVEDAIDTLALFVGLFEDVGYRVLGAESVEEAMRQLRAEPRVDFVLVDYNLGDGTGTAMIHQALNEGLLNLKVTPALVCTAYRYIELPPDVAIVHKPVDPDALLREVEDTLARREREGGWRMPLIDHGVSCFDFVRAMQLAGFNTHGATIGHALIARGDVELRVPQQDDLAEDTILALLQKAQMTPLAFVALLNRLGSRDTWPSVDEPAKRRRR